jgi:hypothetical protein
MTMFMFDWRVAKLVGSDAATIFQSILFWTRHNKANGTNFRDGRWWTFNSIKAWEQQFPHLSGPQIRRCLEKLEKAELIVTGCYNQQWSDRRKWYAVFDNGDLTDPENDTRRRREMPFSDTGKCSSTDINTVDSPTDSESESDTDSESDSYPTESDSQYVAADAGDRRRASPNPKPERPQLTLVADNPAKRPEPIDEALNCYRIVAERRGLPLVVKLTAERRRKLLARLREHGLDDWKTAMRNLDESPHCRGENDRGWRANLDFCLQPTSFVKLLEGAYGKAKPNTPPSKPQTNPNLTEEQILEIEARWREQDKIRAAARKPALTIEEQIEIEARWMNEEKIRHTANGTAQ